MAEVLRCADRWGREVILYEDTWYDKILVDHPEVADELDVVELTLTNPDRVTFDTGHDTGENFCRFAVLRYPYDSLYLKVVVRFDERDDFARGVVISVYPTRDYSQGSERMKWHRQGRR